MAQTPQAVKTSPEQQQTLSQTPNLPSAQPQPRTEMQAVVYQLQQIRPQIALTLPTQIKPESFERVVITAINRQPALLQADRRSLFNACHQAAQDGLLPDGHEGALVIFKSKVKGEDGRDKWIDKVQWMPMVFGIIKKLRQSGEIAAVSARVVYAEEVKQGKFKFIVDEGSERLTHEPILVGERGEPVLVYATARFKDGTVQNEPLTMADIEKVRRTSRSKDKDGNSFGPWKDWFEEMCRKTAIRRLSKYLPLSAEDRRVVEREDEQTDFDVQKNAAMQDIGGAAALLGAPADEESKPVTFEPAERQPGEDAA